MLFRKKVGQTSSLLKCKLTFYSTPKKHFHQRVEDAIKGGEIEGRGPGACPLTFFKNRQN